MKGLRRFRVTREIEVFASSAREAAEMAVEAHRAPYGGPVVCSVRDYEGNEETVEIAGTVSI